MQTPFATQGFDDLSHSKQWMRNDGCGYPNQEFVLIKAAPPPKKKLTNNQAFFPQARGYSGFRPQISIGEKSKKPPKSRQKGGDFRGASKVWIPTLCIQFLGGERERESTFNFPMESHIKTSKNQKCCFLWSKKEPRLYFTLMA